MVCVHCIQSYNKRTIIYNVCSSFALFLEKNAAKALLFQIKAIPLHSQTRVSPVRHAPSEFPQGLTAARVLGCSGAI